MGEMKLPKILAVYLPQFYENEDNNLWWGKGFTDWETVKSAEKYFQGHNEPRIPLGRVYYDLSKKETMQEQARLAKKYGIGGFCFYHYYFKEGKRTLELPAENLLRWKDIDMPFCFNWASESWIRSWSRMSGNVWAEKYENAGIETANGVLVQQDYGSYPDWVRHFEYLLPFLRDDRYIKQDGKPVFVFYSPNDIKPLKEMTECWRKLAVLSGLPGLYLIGAHLNAPNGCLDAALIYEPRNSINILNNLGKVEIKNGVRCFGYQETWETLLESEPFFGYKTYFCGISGYDDTPRRGQSGESLIHVSAGIFRSNLVKLLQKSVRHGNEYLFINAWNEWGEGMYLEPDEEEGYAYLEAIRDAAREAEMVADETEAVDDMEAVKKEISALNYQSNKFKDLFQILDKWLFLEQEGKVDFASFLEAEKIGSVAIYGMAALGKHLLLQLRKERLEAAFGIDRYVGQFGEGFKVYRPEENWPSVDAIIITAYDTVSISEQLRCCHKGRIFTLDSILDVMMNDMQKD